MNIGALTESASSSWKFRYFSIFIGQSFSLVGSSLTQFVLMWWIADNTNSISALGIAGFFALLPQGILGPLAGTIADRYNRRVIMIVTDLISALCMCVLIFLFLKNSIELWQIYLMMAIRSSMQAFQQPAANASTAMLVPTSFLTRASGLNQFATSMMLVVAAPMGAVAVTLMPLGYVLAIDVVTAILAVIPLFIFKIPQSKRDGNDKSSFISELRDGVSIVYNNKGLRYLYLLVGFATIAVMPSLPLLPLLVKSHFGGGASEVGLIEGLSGIGMVLGGLILTIINPKRKVILILWGLSLSCLTMAMTAIVPSNLFYTGVFWYFLCGLTYVFGSGPLTALIQSITPNHYQGRALGLLATCLTLGAPIGLLLLTPLGNILGVRWLFVVTGTIATLVLLLGFTLKDIRFIENVNND